MPREIRSVRMSSWASSDIIEIAAYMRLSESEETVRRVAARIIQVVHKLKYTAFAWRERDDLFDGARVVHARPYAILYKITDSRDVVVVRIVHGRRDLNALFTDKWNAFIE